MTYEVTLTFWVSAGFLGYSSEDVWLYRIIELPFPPFIGLDFKDIEFEGTQVVWDRETETFTVYGEENKELYDWMRSRPFRHTEDDNEYRTKRLREIVEGYKADGWFEEVRA